MMNVLMEIDVLSLMHMMKAEIKYIDNIVTQCFLMVLKILGKINIVITLFQMELKNLIPAN